MQPWTFSSQPWRHAPRGEGRIPPRPVRRRPPHPAANPPPTLVELYAQDPVIAAACVPFAPTMTRVLAAIAAGLPTLR
jgi:hypothetical protein